MCWRPPRGAQVDAGPQRVLMLWGLISLSLFFVLTHDHFEVTRIMSGTQRSRGGPTVELLELWEGGRESTQPGSVSRNPQEIVINANAAWIYSFRAFL